MNLNSTERRLLNNYQRDFPLVAEPFKVIAEQLGTDAATVLKMLQRFLRSGVISRVGPVFRPNTIGSSTLAAMSVPSPRLAAVAGRISAYREVNHNYERDHEFNLWFVVNTATQQRRDAVVKEIEEESGLPVMSLPLVRYYHIDLGFDLDFSDIVPYKPVKPVKDGMGSGSTITRPNRDLISVLQGGLSLVDKPFADVACRTGLSESLVLTLINNMLRTGAIKRFGVVVRHHELGYRANAMCVWDVPDETVDRIGETLAQKSYVTLCYRRHRRLPHWPYNLFCMIHGKHRSRVLEQVEALTEECNLENRPRSVLFSGRRFKQRGAFYPSQMDLQRGSTVAAYG